MCQMKMAKLTLVIVAFLAVGGVNCMEYIESELAQLPKLFHLDDYEKCLDQQDGIYCLGQFQVYNEIEDHPTFNYIEKYSQDRYLYNRSYIHRGYCLPKRCPSSETNLSARFETCVDKWAKYHHKLRARLVTLHYCQEHGHPPSSAPDTSDTPHRAFLYVVYFILFMNFVGTVHDLTSPRGKKIQLLRLWSVRVNWIKLTASFEDGDPRLRQLEALDGIKFLLVVGMIYAHVCIFSGMAPQQHPRNIEKLLLGPSGPMVGALTTCTQTFVVLSNFLTAYNILMASQKNKIGFRYFPLLVIKRLVRMYPVYLLAMGFAATWWTSIGQGPLWPLIVGRESAVCRKKFWVSVGFLQNVFDPEQICQVQTWIMAVDMQLHLAVLTTTLLAIKYRRWAFHILSACIVGALGITTYVGFAKSFYPVYYSMTPENFRQLFMNDRTMTHFFITPFNCVLSAMVGTTLAFVHQECQERGFKLSERPILRKLHYAIVPLVFAWAYACYFFKRSTDPWVMSAMLPVERIVYSTLGCIFIFSITNTKSILTSIFGWKPLRPLARMSMSLSMVHWCVNAWIVASRYNALDTRMPDMMLDLIGTWVYSHMLAVPMTILVESPMQKFIERIVMKFVRR